MPTLFYDHLINLADINRKLDGYNLTVKEKQELLKAIDTAIHHEVLNVILEHLPSMHHEEFLEKFSSEPHSSAHIVYINERIEANIEQEIIRVVRVVVEAI